MTDAGRRRLLGVAAAGALTVAATPSGRAQPRGPAPGSRVLAVGPLRPLRLPSAAAAMVADGDVVEIDAGDYANDVALWSVPRLEIRAVGGRVRLRGGAASIENKGIWVNRCGALSVTGVDFWGARSSHGNGAGIRHELGLLTATDCGFFDNQNGILTNNDAQCRLVLASCEFGRNGHGDGQTHNLYAGSIAQLDVQACWFHDAQGGHLLKSRARVNRVAYSLMADSADGTSSYELEFPNGGDCVVVGNLLLQAAGTQNPHLVSYGTEGLRAGANRLLLVQNTWVDRRPRGGVFLRLAGGASTDAALWNNLFLGSGRLPDAAFLAQGNLSASESDLEQAAAGNYRPRRGGRAWQAAVPLPAQLAAEALPTHEYLHPRRLQPLVTAPRHAGASQTSRLALAGP